MSDLPPPPPEFEPESSSQPPPPADPSSHAPQAMTGWAALGTGERVELASPGARLGARLLDFVIMVIAVFVLALIFGASISLGSGSDEGIGLILGAFLGVILLFGLAGIAYEVTMIALKGQTVGKMATSVKVIRADNGQLPGWGKAIARWFIPTLLGIIPFIGWVLALLCYLSLTWDKVRQGWHDKAAATLVVKA